LAKAPIPGQQRSATLRVGTSAQPPGPGLCSILNTFVLVTITLAGWLVLCMLAA
jgi:hypothetical protein